MNNQTECLNCIADKQEYGVPMCYECYILSGQEEKDLRKNGADENTLKKFGYEVKPECLKIEKAELDFAIGIAQANMFDELDQRNDKGYWEGYHDALIHLKKGMVLLNTKSD